VFKLLFRDSYLLHFAYAHNIRYVMLLNVFIVLRLITARRYAEHDIATASCLFVCLSVRPFVRDVEVS